MNKYLRSMKWFREMSVLAEDEQRRSRHPEIDSEHLLLALVSIGGPVSDALAGRGVTLASTREAAERTHRERIAKLGISLPEETPRTIPVEPYRGEFRYRKELRTALEKAACQPQPDVSLFRHLLQEPSGRVREVLQDLGSHLRALTSRPPRPPQPMPSSPIAASSPHRPRRCGRCCPTPTAGSGGTTCPSPMPRWTRLAWCGPGPEAPPHNEANTG